MAANIWYIIAPKPIWAMVRLNCVAANVRMMATDEFRMSIEKWP
jgi:hypothetical protein